MEEKMEEKMMEDQKPYEVKVKETTPAMDKQSFFSVIERLASNPDVDVEKIQRIMNMQEQLLNRTAKQAFNAAMVRAQQKMPVVGKDKKNEQTHSMYAGYETIIKACQPVYTKEGFSVTFYQGHGTEEVPIGKDEIRVMADIMHEGGHTKTVYVDIPVETTGPKGGVLMTKTHATGSGFAYGKSYLLRMIFNIPTGGDDDGNAAGGIQFITEEQISTILDFINAKNVDQAKFLKYMNAKTIELIPAADFKKAVASLRMAKGTAAT